MISHNYLIAIIAIMAVITFLLRAFPFLVLKNKKIKFIDYLGFIMPPGIMVILVVYSFIPSQTVDYVHYLKLLLASLMVVLLHHFFRNPLLSIIPSTGVFIALQYVSFNT